MKYCSEFTYHFADIVGDRKKVDNTIYTFDIETSNFLILDNKIIPACKYLELTEEERQACVFRSNMYIWMFGINDVVYYGRTWEELRSFLIRLEYYNSNKKIIFVHNLSFEFQYLKTVFAFSSVTARKKRKVMKAILRDFNIEFHCSYMMSNCSLAILPKVYNLKINKKVGDLNYDLLRTSSTELSAKEKGYCEYDCLVVFEFIKQELETYKRVDKIPITSTGHVRRELKEKTEKDWKYKNSVRKAINIDPHIYNLLQDCFMRSDIHTQIGFIQMKF